MANTKVHLKRRPEHQAAACGLLHPRCWTSHPSEVTCQRCHTRTLQMAAAAGVSTVNDNERSTLS